MLSESDSVRSPDWWLLYLGRKLTERGRHLRLYRQYYRGQHPLPQGFERDMDRASYEAWLLFQRKSRTNFCRLPVIATVNRQLAIGVTDGEGNEDKQAWSWWQLNRMDSRQKQLYRLLLSTGYAYLMTGPHPADSARPLMTIEHPGEVITETDPATGDVEASLKAWIDPIGQVARATVYLGDKLFRYQGQVEARKLAWTKQFWTPTGDQTNVVGKPPVVCFEREPDVGEHPEPDFWQIRDLQDRLNLSVLNRMTIERYAAHPQKWSTGTKVQKIRDPLTGLEIPVNPYRPGADSTWINENPDGKFGYIPAADLLQLLKSHEFDIRSMFVLTSTPAYYLPLDLVNVSTDTVLALDANHVAKVNELNTDLGEGLEAAFAMAATVARVGEERDFTSHEISWADPRQLNPAVIADMAVKKHSIGWPLAMLAEDMGESPQRVQRLRTEVAAEKLLAFGQQDQTAGQLQQAGQGQVGQGQPVGSGPLKVQIPDALQGLV